MVIAKEIERRVDGFPLQTVFTIDDLGIPAEWWESVRVKLARMVESGILSKIGKGRFYRPQSTVFGNVGPSQEEMVKDLLEKDGLPIGYITGYARWNQMGLTSQISGIIQIATNNPKKSLRRGRYWVKFIKQPNKITASNIRYLTVLDALNNIKRIPDTTLIDAAKVVSGIIERFTVGDISEIVSLAMKYPARSRALLGAILERIGRQDEAAPLHSSLNPLTYYTYPGIASYLGNSLKWHIR